jgi:hypothetical protein
MTRPRTILLALVVAALAGAQLSAQTAQLAWSAPANAVSAAEAQSLTYTLYVNNGTAIPVTGVSCTGTAPPFDCTSPVPSGVPIALGTKLELTAKVGSSEESPRSLPFTIPPVAPTNLRKR